MCGCRYSCGCHVALCHVRMRKRILASCVGVSGVVCHVWVWVGVGVSDEGYRLHVFQSVGGPRVKVLTKAGEGVGQGFYVTRFTASLTINVFDLFFRHLYFSFLSFTTFDSLGT